MRLIIPSLCLLSFWNAITGVADQTAKLSDGLREAILLRGRPLYFEPQMKKALARSQGL